MSLSLFPLLHSLHSSFLYLFFIFLHPLLSNLYSVPFFLFTSPPSLPSSFHPAPFSPIFLSSRPFLSYLPFTPAPFLSHLSFTPSLPPSPSLHSSFCSLQLSSSSPFLLFLHNESCLTRAHNVMALFVYQTSSVGLMFLKSDWLVWIM